MPAFNLYLPLDLYVRVKRELATGEAAKIAQAALKAAVDSRVRNQHLDAWMAVARIGSISNLWVG